VFSPFSCYLFLRDLRALYVQKEHEIVSNPASDGRRQIDRAKVLITPSRSLIAGGRVYLTRTAGRKRMLSDALIGFFWVEEED
jgi:hypothetical protein